MPFLPLPSETTLGSEIPVSSTSDVLAEFATPQRNPETAPNRDAIAEAYADGFVEYQNAAERAAAQSDPLRATGNYLKAYADEHQVIPLPGESEDSLRARLFDSPQIVTPEAIEAIINEVISPLTCKISELDMDGWFIHASMPGVGDQSVWDSFVGTEPNYPDRYYDDQPSLRVGGCVPSNNLPRSFHVRIPSLNAQDESYDYMGTFAIVLQDGTFSTTGWFVGDDLNIYHDQATSVDKYNTIIARVEKIKGQGISWSMIVDPTL